MALKEQLSLAYVQAVATAAAGQIDDWSVDYVGIDVTIRQMQPLHTKYQHTELHHVRHARQPLIPVSADDSTERT